MDMSEPTRMLVPGLTMPVLRALAARSTPATAEQVRRVAGTGTPAGVRRTLDRLAEHGLLNRVSYGERATVYHLNDDHLLYPAVQVLLAVGDELPSRLTDAISRWRHPPASAALFGSAARRDGSLDSDVDLLVVPPPQLAAESAPEWDEQLHALRGQVLRWTGNHLQVLDRSREQLASLADAGEKLIAELQRDAITVYGTEIRELLEER